MQTAPSPATNPRETPGNVGGLFGTGSPSSPPVLGHVSRRLPFGQPYQSVSIPDNSGASQCESCSRLLELRTRPSGWHVSHLCGTRGIFGFRRTLEATHTDTALTGDIVRERTPGLSRLFSLGSFSRIILRPRSWEFAVQRGNQSNAGPFCALVWHESARNSPVAHCGTATRDHSARRASEFR